MKVAVAPVLADTQSQLSALGERLRLARLRRHLSADALASLSGISRVTVFRIEKGAPSVAMGAYLRVMECLDCADEISTLAVADVWGRQLQDRQLPAQARRSASHTSSAVVASNADLWAFKRENQRRDIEAVSSRRASSESMSWFTPQQARDAVIVGEPL